MASLASYFLRALIFLRCGPRKQCSLSLNFLGFPDGSASEVDCHGVWVGFLVFASLIPESLDNRSCDGREKNELREWAGHS